MPDVGLTTADEKLSRKLPVIIEYSVEVGGLPVYQESYDARKLEKEIADDRAGFAELWLRRVECVVKAIHENAFSATLTACLSGRELSGGSEHKPSRDAKTARSPRKTKS